MGVGLAAVCLLFLFSGREVAGVQRSSVDGKVIRVIVFNFENQAGAAKQKDIARVFRRELHTFPELRLLDMPAINRALEPAALSGEAGEAAIEKAAYVGASVGADRVLIGTVERVGNITRLSASVIDTGRSVVDFTENIDRERIEEKDAAAFARLVARRMLGLSPERKDAVAPGGPQHHRAGVSFGVLAPGAGIRPYLEKAQLTCLHYVWPLSAPSGAGIEFTAGYARAQSDDSIPGDVSLALVPFTAMVRYGRPLFGSRYVPEPVLLAGGGATWLRLSGESAGRDASRSGFDWTLAAGMGLALDAWGPLCIQARAMAYYLYEDITVMYWYCGAMIEYRLGIRD